MAGRFQKNNGATLVLERAPSKQATPELRRFKPDFYVPVQKPIKSPNLLQKTAQRSFGKRVVESAASAVAKRAPLAVAGPLGDLLALGLISWDLYQLLLELQNMSNPVASQPGLPNPSEWDDADYWVLPGWSRGPTGPTGGFLGSPLTLSTHSWAGSTATPTNLGWQVNVGTSSSNRNVTSTGLSPAPDYFTLQEAIANTPVGDHWRRYSPVTFVPPISGVQPDGEMWSDLWNHDLDLGGETYIGGYGTPEAYPSDIPLDWAEPDPNMKRGMFPDGINMTTQLDREPQTDPRYKRGPRIRPPRPQRPDERVRERKMKGPLQLILKVMDIVSESGEFVGAFYDALPKDVRQKWEAKYVNGHFAEVDGKWKWVIDKRGLIDNAGQYGIDGADWKARALWHNWHKVDIEQAIKNVIANELQDKILGLYQRLLPNNIGHVADAGSLGLNELITLFNKTIGLS